MKKLIIFIGLLICAAILTGCELYEKSAEVLDIHKDCIEELHLEGLLKLDEDVIVNDAWIKNSFVESRIKLEDDGDFEIYILLKYRTKLTVNTTWFYVQVLGLDIAEIKEVNALWVNLNTALDFKTTTRIDKRWEG